MRLLDDESGVNAQYDRKGKDAVAELPQLFLVGDQQVGKQQNQREFGQLRGLELEVADEDPPVGVIDRRHEIAEDEQRGDDREQRPGKLAPEVVIHTGKNEHGAKPCYRPHQLPGNVVEAVALPVIALGIAGGKHHNKAEYKQQQDQHHKGEVHAGVFVPGEQSPKPAARLFPMLFGQWVATSPVGMKWVPAVCPAGLR